MKEPLKQYIALHFSDVPKESLTPQAIKMIEDTFGYACFQVAYHMKKIAEPEQKLIVKALNKAIKFKGW